MLRAALRALEVPYSAVVNARNRRYDTGRLAVHRAGVPVLSVGNITLGGTGKTPAVAWLAGWFTERGVRVGLVSRGYGSTPGQPNDEALELAQRLPDVPHVADSDRVRGAQLAIERFGCQLLIMDDGFQHRRLARDFDLVLIDALAPFGYEHVVPRGTLREPLSGWARADALMLTRADLVDQSRRAEIRARALRYAPRAMWLEAVHAPQALLSPEGHRQPLESLRGQRISAFCGIGNPAGFWQSLERCGYQTVDRLEFADHMQYTSEHLSEIGRRSEAADAAAALCTHKDLVKVGPHWRRQTPLFALYGGLAIASGQSELESAIERLLPRAATSR